MGKRVNPEMVDNENPEWTDADFRRARPASEVLPAELVAVLPKRRGPAKKPVKRQVTLRLDAAVVEAFKATGRGWQTRINAALKKVAPHGA